MPRHRKTQETNFHSWFTVHSLTRHLLKGCLQPSAVWMFSSNVCCLHAISRHRFALLLKYFVHLRGIGVAYLGYIGDKLLVVAIVESCSASINRIGRS